MEIEGRCEEEQLKRTKAHYSSMASGDAWEANKWFSGFTSDTVSEHMARAFEPPTSEKALGEFQWYKKLADNPEEVRRRLSDHDWLNGGPNSETSEELLTLSGKYTGTLTFENFRRPVFTCDETSRRAQGAGICEC